jgi:hypothetical protein
MKRFCGSPAWNPSVVAAPVYDDGGGVRHDGDRSDGGVRDIASITCRAESDRHNRNDAPKGRTDQQASAYTEGASQVVSVPANPPPYFND